MERSTNPLCRVSASYYVIAAVFLLLAPLILTGKTLFWGTIVTQFIPWRTYAWESLLQGTFPLWNPLVGAGAPLLANYQSAILYPPNWISLGAYILGGIQIAAWSETFLLFFHLGLAGVGMVLLVREIGVGSRGQRISGLAFGLSSYLVARGSFPSLIATVAWTPWVMLFVERLVTRKGAALRKIWLQLVIVLALLLLAGHAQSAWYVLILAGSWAIVRALRTPDGGWKKASRVLLSLALCLLAGILLASVQLLPTYEYLQLSPRASEVDYEIAMTYSFWPWRLLTFFAPDLFGNPRAGDYIGYASFWEDAAYIGLLPLLLAIAVVLRNLRNSFLRRTPKKKQTSRMFYFLVVIIIFGVILALGRNTPLFPFLYRHVPTFDMFKSPARYLLWSVFGLAILAGIGADAWRRPTGRWLYWSRLATAAGFAITLGAGIGWAVIGEVSPTFIKAIALTGVFGVAAGLFNLRVPLESPCDSEKANRQDTIWELALIGFVTIDLLVAGWGMNPGLAVNTFRIQDDTTDLMQERIDQRRLYLPAEVEYDLKFKRYFMLDTYSPAEGWAGLIESNLPNINMLSGKASLNNFDPLVPARYERWMKLLEDSSSVKQMEYLNLSAVGMVGIIDSARQSGIRYEEVQSEGRIRWLPCAVFAENGEDALDLIGNETIDLNNTIVLEGVESAPQPGCARSDQSFTLNLNKEMPAHISVQTHTPHDGWLLLADILYPGWIAFLDGQQVEILTGDYLFRAIWLPEGEHTVEFAYQPRSFWIGLWISILGWFVVGAAFIWHIRTLKASPEK